MIHNLRSGTEGASKEKELHLKKNADLRRQIAELQEELHRERERVDLKAANKKLLRLQKERTDQDKVIINLRKAIDGFGERMLKYESEKVQAEEKDGIALRKEALTKQEADKDIKAQQTKIKLIENQRDKIKTELADLKVVAIRKDEELQALKT